MYACFTGGLLEPAVLGVVRIDHHDALETPGMLPAVAAILNRCCWRCTLVSSCPSPPSLDPAQSQATLDSCCRRTRHNPNSEKTPPPRPVSVHLFFTAVGRVCTRGMRGELVSVRVLQRLAEKREEIIPTARGKALSLSIAADRTLASTVSFRTMKRYARRSSSLAKRKVSAKITRVQGEELACDSLAGVEVLEREVTRKRSDHLNLGATVPSASVGHSSGEMYTG